MNQAVRLAFEFAGVGLIAYGLHQWSSTMWVFLGIVFLLWSEGIRREISK